MMKGKHILIGVTGGIAAYKIPFLVRECKKLGADVKIVMTEAATEFVTPLTLSTLSRNDVIVGTFPEKSSMGSRRGTWHVDLARWANIAIIAPATANVLAKLAHGYADDAVSTLVLAMKCPVVVSPAMDVDMWHHQTTQRNVTMLQEMGYHILPPEEGELASGLRGEGRLPEALKIVHAIVDVLRHAREDLRGKKILITAGPTREPIDPVRYIGNRSSGKMGFALANAAAQRGAKVTLISGRVHLATPRHVHRIDVETAAEMYTAVMKHRSAGAIIMAAAVADFRPRTPSTRKIKKNALNDQSISLELIRTKDILADLSRKKTAALLVGFALETDNGMQHAKEKLREKHLDYIVLNNPNEEGAAFGHDTNVVTIISRQGKVQKLKKLSKFAVAHEILDRIARDVK